jgi:hypothetical protein
MTAHKPAVPPSFLSTSMAKVSYSLHNTVVVLSAHVPTQEAPPLDDSDKPMYAFPANEQVVEVIRHTSDLSKAEVPVYNTMANMPEGFNDQYAYNVVAQNKRYEYFADEATNAIQEHADAN